jgi:DNA repair protein RadC
VFTGDYGVLGQATGLACDVKTTLEMNRMDDASLLAMALGLRDPAALRDPLQAVGGLGGLRAAGAESLREGLRTVTRRRLEALLEVFEVMLNTRPPLPTIASPQDVAAYFLPLLQGIAMETFWVLMLDARGRPISHHKVAQGTLTACLVHPREVFARAIRARAASIIAVHNHPSGDPTPSDDDVRLTERLHEAGLLLGIPLVDHVVVGGGGFQTITPGRMFRKAGASSPDLVA